MPATPHAILRRAATAALALLALTSLAAADERPAIVFRDAEAAAAEAAAQERVLALYFTADWCGWCRKMEASTFADAGVIDAAQAFAWAKVDIDDRPDLAATFGVRGVPALAFLNARGELLGERAGYAAAPQMLGLLAEYRGKALAPGAFREGLGKLMQTRAALADAATDAEVDAAVRQTVDLLADPRQRPQRERLRHAVLAVGPRAWPTLAALAGDERLATRAAASDLLRGAAPAAPAVDPFAEPADREPQLAALRAWLAEQMRVELPDAAPAAE